MTEDECIEVIKELWVTDEGIIGHIPNDENDDCFPRLSPEEERAVIEQWLEEYPGATIGISYGELVLDTRPSEDFSSEDTLPYMPEVFHPTVWQLKQERKVQML